MILWFLRIFEEAETSSVVLVLALEKLSRKI